MPDFALPEIGTFSVKKTANNSATYAKKSSRSTASEIKTFHVVTDDGAGNWADSRGLINYAGKSFTLKTTADYAAATYQTDHQTEASWQDNISDSGAAGTTGGAGQTGVKGGEWGSRTAKDNFAGAAVEVSYRAAGAGVLAHTMSYTPPALQIDLCPYTRDRIVPNSVQFTWMGKTYVDFEGSIYRDRTESSAGILSGTIDYTAGVATMTDYVVGAGAFTLQSLWTTKGDWSAAALYLRTAGAPLKPGGFVLSVVDAGGNQLVATGNLSGDITGTHCKGKIDYETGVVEILFGDYVADAALTAAQKAEWWYSAAEVNPVTQQIWRPWPVDPATARYNAVIYQIIPLSAEILGLDPVRLPGDGRVPIFRAGDVTVVHHTASLAPQTVANAQTVDCGRTRLARIRVIGNDGNTISGGYSTDLDAGTLTFTNVAGYSQPVTIEHRIEDMALVSEVQITGQIAFTRQLTHDFPLGSYASSALIIGDMHARVSVLFDQATWSNAWADAVSGSSATGTFNDAAYPIEVANTGAITERWVLKFTNTTTFDVIGEHVGQIATGNTATDLAVINPATGTPYFTVRAAGFGAGWAAGNALRFNTVGAQAPVWVARTIRQGPASAQDDAFTLLIRGDVDNP